MGLELSQLHNLLANRQAAIQIEYLPAPVAKYLGCPLGIAYLSSISLHHILKEHPDVQLLDMLCLPMMVKHGQWVADRPGSACVLYRHPETGLGYKSALKATAGGYETYLSTFHRCEGKQRKSILKRGELLTP